MAPSPLAALEQPFPGLRAFEPHEAYLFRGREQHTEELLTRLAEHRFMAVVGNSGSGKSSLVRAGLLPALYRGYLTGATTRWRIAILRPGAAPMEALGVALSDSHALGDSFGAAGPDLLVSSSMGLVRVVERAGLRPGESLLVVVDQFEELFRFRKETQARDGGAEAALFVRSLLGAVETFGVPVYVAVTMRSDYLGDCAQFAGLTEALNRGQYLVPRLTREQRRQAIEEPAAMAGLSIEPRLVQRFLNDAGDDPDQLPVLAHALMRTFHAWKAAGAEGPIDLEHYEQAGGIGSALDNHADSILSELGAAAEPWAQKVFRCLTVLENGRDVRRPARLGRIYEVAGAAAPEDRAAVDAVVLAFSRREDSLLVRSGSGPLAPGDVVDITHECLLRKWSVLKTWLRAESRSVEWYCDLASDVLRHAAGEKGLWRNPDLAQVLKLKEENGWNAAWAAQYWPEESEPSFPVVETFLTESRNAQEAEQLAEEARRRREVEEARQLAHARKRASQWLAGAAVLLALLLIGGSIAAWLQWRRSRAFEQERAMRLKAEQALSSLYSERDEHKARVEYLNRQLATASDAEADQVQRKLKDAQEQLRKTDSEIAKKQAVAPTAAPNDSAVGQIEALRTQVSALRVQLDQARQQVNRGGGSPVSVKIAAVSPGAPSKPAPAPAPRKAEPLSADQIRAIKQILAVLEIGRPDAAAWEQWRNLLVLQNYVQSPGPAGQAKLEAYKGAKNLADLRSLRPEDWNALVPLVQDDPVFKNLMSEYGPEVIWERAAGQAGSLGITTALGTAIVFESTVLGAFNLVRDRTTAKIGGVPAAGTDERAWIQTYVAERRQWLDSRGDSVRAEAIRRLEALAALVQGGNWDLKRPFQVGTVPVE